MVFPLVRVIHGFCVIFTEGLRVIHIELVIKFCDDAGCLEHVPGIVNAPP